MRCDFSIFRACSRSLRSYIRYPRKTLPRLSKPEPRVIKFVQTAVTLNVTAILDDRLTVEALEVAQGAHARRELLQPIVRGVHVDQLLESAVGVADDRVKRGYEVAGNVQQAQARGP